MLKKSILMGVGSVIFVIGLILFPLPVPLGLPTMIIGLSIILKASYKVKRLTIQLFKKNRHSKHVWNKGRDFRRKRNNVNSVE